MSKNHKFNNMKTWKKVLLISLIVLLVLLIVAFSIGFGYIKDLVKKMNEPVIIDEPTEEIKEEDIFKDYEYELQPVDGYINILLLGIDSRDMTRLSGTRSDMMIIASINEETFEVKLTSIYRDTYTKLGSTSKYNRVNAAMTYGGPELSVETINQMLDLDIEYYAVINFKGVSDLIDGIGGVYVEILDSEIDELNKYVVKNANIIGRENYNLFKESGYQWIDGIQAVSYGRIRKDNKTGDVRRTERMRTIITATLEKMKTLKPSEIKKLIDNMVSEIKTNMQLNDIFGLAKHITKYQIADGYGWPKNAKSAIYNGKWLFFPDDLVYNAKWFHKTVFLDEEYKPSSRLKKISEVLEDTYKEAKAQKETKAEDEDTGEIIDVPPEDDKPAVPPEGTEPEVEEPNENPEN